VEAGHRSIVLACEGSRAIGDLVSAPVPSCSFDTRVHAEAATRYKRILATLLARTSVDVVHFHGHDFDMYLPAEGVAALATIHLPPEFLISKLTHIHRRATWANGVSRAQHARLPAVPFLLPPIENGVSVETGPVTRRRDFALVLGRICPEKGVHVALEAARRARVRVLVAGAAFPYEEHQRYFTEEVVPRLGRDSRCVGPVSKRRKLRLLNAARCVLVASVVEETSSLVAMEAMACGTPVVAFASGALTEIVEHGVTGFIVQSVDEMASAILRTEEIDPNVCRHIARSRFSSRRMVEEYLERYEQVLSWSRTSIAEPTASSSSS
jgi:glycosyltransferase involved in cell wall biosynthesis